MSGSNAMTDPRSRSSLRGAGRGKCGFGAPGGEGPSDPADQPRGVGQSNRAGQPRPAPWDEDARAPRLPFAMPMARGAPRALPVAQTISASDPGQVSNPAASVSFEAALPRAVPPPPLSAAPPAGEVSSHSSGPAGEQVPSRDRGQDHEGGQVAARLAVLRRLIGPHDPGAGVLAQMDDAYDGVHGGAAATCWRLGDDRVDHLLGSVGLAVDGLHEVKPALSDAGGCHAGERAAALAFALRLVQRRMMAAAAEHGAGPAPVLLWCQPRHAAGEMGQLHAPGLQSVGIDPARVIVVETSRREETLWAMEEGLASGTLALVGGIVDDIALTPARRLALRAERHRTPCLVLTSPHAAATAATASRWRIARHRGGSHPFDPRAPGALRLAVALERCRQRPLLAAHAFTLEWSDEAYRFHMASGLADRADGAYGRQRTA